MIRDNYLMSEDEHAKASNYEGQFLLVKKIVEVHIEEKFAQAKCSHNLPQKVAIIME